ncbi:MULTISPECIES: aminotransferase class V-fold PLP-dependent enzyme [unclassified Microbacterium]|uniref:aminotransferase class V-fold PLP-dependent enzyme n=1 Tax=unclassified Microbacterium TaxID=2609290 RepID=UPI003018CCF8
MNELSSMIDSFGDVAPGYLDWARFGPLSPVVRAEMSADTETLGTGRSAGIDLVAARSDEARDLVARVMDLPVDEIVLQPSTSYGLQHAFLGLTGTVVLPALEFPAMRLAAGRAAAARGLLAVREIDPPAGIVTPADIATALTDEVTAVALSLVDFRTGAVADLEGIRGVIGDRLLIVDAIQGFGVTDVEWTAADVIVGNGYKWLRAGRGTGFARFSPRARERIEPVLSGISGMVGDETTRGVPQAVAGAAAYSVAPGDPLAASRLVAALREILDAGVGAVAATVRERAQEVMQLADGFGLPVITPRDAHAGIVTLMPDAADAPALAAALANHGLTVTARGGGIRVSTHVGGGCVGELGDALADAAARRAVTIDLAPDLGAGLPAAEVFTIELPEDASAGLAADTVGEEAVDAEPAAPVDPAAEQPASAEHAEPQEFTPLPEDAATQELTVSTEHTGAWGADGDEPDDEIVIATVEDDEPHGDDEARADDETRVDDGTRVDDETRGADGDRQPDAVQI